VPRITNGERRDGLITKISNTWAASTSLIGTERLAERIRLQIKLCDRFIAIPRTAENIVMGRLAQGRDRNGASAPEVGG